MKLGTCCKSALSKGSNYKKIAWELNHKIKKINTAPHLNKYIEDQKINQISK